MSGRPLRTKFSMNCCCGEGRKQDLEALQNRAARIVACTVRSKQAMEVLKWPTLEERRRKSVFKLVKKCLQGQCSQYFKQYFKRNNTIHARATRQSNLLHPPAVRTEIEIGSTSAAKGKSRKSLSFSLLEKIKKPQSLI